MKLILEPALPLKTSPELPPGVSLLERLDSGSVVVETDVRGEGVLRSSRVWKSVRAPGFVTLPPRGVEPSSFVDVHSNADLARARIANLKLARGSN